MKKQMWLWIGLALLAPSLWADQLQWNSAAVTEAALEVIRPHSVLVSYCSECDDERIEVLRVIDAVPTVTGNDDLLEIKIFARRMFISRERFDSGGYRRTADYVEAEPDAGHSIVSDVYESRAIDLAYVYVPNKKNRFVCACRALGLACEVSVKRITLPPWVLERLAGTVTREGFRGDEEVVPVDLRGKVVD